MWLSISLFDQVEFFSSYNTKLITVSDTNFVLQFSRYCGSRKKILSSGQRSAVSSLSCQLIATFGISIETPRPKLRQKHKDFAGLISSYRWRITDEFERAEPSSQLQPEGTTLLMILAIIITLANGRVR